MIALALQVPAMTTAPHGRSLSYAQILKYSPGSQVTDHSNIDLDQKAMEDELKSPPNWATAKAIYTTGAHSKPSAVCTLTSPTTLGADVAKKAFVSYTSNGGQAVTSGKAYSDYKATDTSLTFTYPVSQDRVQSAATSCYAGGMASTNWKTSGCIDGSSGGGASGEGDASSTFTIGSTTYTATCTNRGKRTLQGFSTGAKSKMYDCPVNSAKSWKNGCPYTSYKPYYDYYGDYAYADSIVLAALDGTKTSFTNGNSDFTTGDGKTDAARVQMAKKGTAYMNTWMYVIREFEDAIDDCTNGDLTANAGSSGPVHAWDEGVGFFIGSIMAPEDLTGAQISSLDSKGKLAYTLGNKRCKNFKTCGPDGNELNGEAKANVELMDLFNAGQHKLLVGKCADVVPIKNKIVSQMTVPLVQGSLRYAYKMAALSGGAKERAEGALFAAAVLPQVHACSASAAKTIYDNMKVNGATVDFNAVKSAFEGCYTAMGITCADVGGLWNSGTSAYYNDNGFNAAPCADASTTGALPGGAIAGIIIAAVIAVLALLCVCVLVRNEKKGQPIFTSLVPKTKTSGNAAAA